MKTFSFFGGKIMANNKDMLASLDDVSSLAEAFEEGMKAFRTLKTAKERAFVHEFVLTQSPFKAACKAGISPKIAHAWGYKVLQNENVRKAIKFFQKELEFEYNLRKEFFIITLRQIIDDPETKPSDKVSALNLLAKLSGHLSDTSSSVQQLVILKHQGLDETIEIKPQPIDMDKV
jgi:phage terminase small subunit